MIPPIVLPLALAGAGVGLGLLFLVAGFRGTALVPFLGTPPLDEVPSRAAGNGSAPGDMFGLEDTLALEAGSGVSADDRAYPREDARRAGRIPKVTTLRMWVLGAALGFLAWLLTGWPALGFLVMLAAGFGSRLFGGRAQRREWIARTQAIASWTEMLRDTMAAADGVEEAIAATVPIAPAAIRREVAALDARRRSEQPLSDALIDFGAEVDHPSCDLVVASLSAAAQGEGSDFVAVLTRLSEMTRDEVRMRMRVETSRAKLRTSSLVILGVVAIALLLMILSARDFLAPYDSILGQIVMVVVAGMLAGGLVMLDRMSRITVPARFSPRRRSEGREYRDQMPPTGPGAPGVQGVRR